MNHPSHRLFERVKRFGGLPPEVAEVPHQLDGTSFFPAGAGLFVTNPAAELPRFPVGGIMALGHDWGTTREFEYCAPRYADRLSNPTWTNLLSFLADAGIDRREVFYTNFFVGLRNAMTSMGPHPARRHRDYVARCQEFLVEQVELQKPRLVLVLGMHVPTLIAPLSDDLNGWSRSATFRSLDAQGLAGIPRVRLRGSTHTFAAAVLVHPCQRLRTVQSRRYRGLSGDAAELNLVADMLGTSSAHITPLAA
jgi:hypothetical protein